MNLTNDRVQYSLSHSRCLLLQMAFFGRKNSYFRYFYVN